MTNIYIPPEPKIQKSCTIHSFGYDFAECIKYECKEYLESVKWREKYGKVIVPNCKHTIKTTPDVVKNLTPNSFLEELGKLICGGGITDVEDIEIKYFSISSDYEVPEKTNTDNNAEFFRKAITLCDFALGNSVVITSMLLEAEAVTSVGTVASAVDNQTFTLQGGEGAGFTSPDRIRVHLNTGVEEVRVGSVATDTITLSTIPPARLLSATPTAGVLVEQMFSKIGLFCGNNPSVGGGGIMPSLSRFYRTKSSTEAVNIFHTIDFI